MQNRHERLILNVLENGAFTTGAIAQQVTFFYGSNRHQHSAYIRRLLLDLERRGFVRRLDDEKPVVWVHRYQENKHVA
ncbi:hypothetical protein ACSI5F_03635 [Ralstonia pseudosolanacearum]|uniref:hypothetical protein n=1 Tax=Ralstonia pseudosolanacearum TaxID=1310165 RepID=UPI003EE3BF75